MQGVVTSSLQVKMTGYVWCNESTPIFDSKQGLNADFKQAIRRKMKGFKKSRSQGTRFYQDYGSCAWHNSVETPANHHCTFEIFLEGQFLFWQKKTVMEMQLMLSRWIYAPATSLHHTLLVPNQVAGERPLLQGWRLFVQGCYHCRPRLQAFDVLFLPRPLTSTAAADWMFSFFAPVSRGGVWQCKKPCSLAIGKTLWSARLPLTKRPVWNIFSSASISGDLLSIASWATSKKGF